MIINTIKKVFNIAMLGVTVFLIINNYTRCSKNREHSLVIEELRADRLEEGKTFRLKEGELVSQLEGVRLENQDLLQKMAEKELEMDRLKGKVKALVSMDRTFEIADTVREVVTKEIPGDTVTINDCLKHIYPVYKREGLGDEWYTLDLRIGRDYTMYELFIKDEIDVSLVHKNRFLKKDLVYVYSKSNNPYVKDQKVAAHIFEEKPSRLGFGISGGIGVTNELKFSPYIGFGLNFNIVNFR